MDSGVFLLQGDDTLIRMVERPYEIESLLQDQLAAHPDLLAGDQINPADPRRWLLVEREAGVPAEAGGADWWALDHLFLDQDATPTFVEVKRAADTRARREVVAQMLDYAANATEYWPIDRLREQFALRCADRGSDPGEELAAFLGPGGDGSAFWDLAKANLRDGRVRLLFVADRIPPSLRRIVEFLNRQMNPAEVLAVEIRQFAPGSDAPLRTLVPRVIGQTEQARQAKAPSRPAGRSMPISVEEFLGKLSPERRDLALAVLRASEANGFGATALREPKGTEKVGLALPGVSGFPASLYPDFLWVSFGRYHPALLEPVANREVRQAVLRVSPATRQAEDPKKSEVGVALDSLVPTEQHGQLPALFGVLRKTLEMS